MTSIADTEADLACSRRIVVAVSPSPSGLAALRLGATLAQGLDAQLHLVRVWRDVDRLFSMTRAEASHLSESQRNDRAVLDDAAALIRAESPELDVHPDFARGDLFSNVLKRSDGALMLLLGAGSTVENSCMIGPWFEKHATCPVVLVGVNGVVTATAGCTLPEPLGFPEDAIQGVRYLGAQSTVERHATQPQIQAAHEAW